ncbi:hypothetical protein S23_14750 [Bradyrhizobium cosmicum]|uniref:Uncharacterized protein n=1 Tax=Bradyrhizobium cosmicum TaxID=1404864 RepID=A0AAI8Q9X6_9BRAD|nr:hypothetical protein S23_14750 [Bradyrhizobium cosmicum]
MRVRVSGGTDGVSVLFRTSDTAACETPAASAISFCVGRAGAGLAALFPRVVLVVDVAIWPSYTYY